MELRESIESINQRLINEFGYEVAYNKPKFRVVFSEDQYERRFTKFTKEGFELLEPVVNLLPKYKQWVHEKYVLERLVPSGEGTDLTEKISYEPAWIFQDKAGNYLPPFYDGCKLVIESLYTKMGIPSSFAKYKDTDSIEERRAHVEKVERELFGDETALSDSLAAGSAVSMAQDSGRPLADRKLVN